jgi:hypothetical protein
VEDRPKFPDDENGDVLRLMEESGDVLEIPRNVDFEHIFETSESAVAFAACALNQTDTVSISWYDEVHCWNVCVTRHMVPSHEAVSTLETSLKKMAQLYGGKADGWGCFKVKASDS